MADCTEGEAAWLAALGRRLAVERTRRNLTQRVVANRAGVSLPTYRKIEYGDPTVSVRLLRRVAARGLGVPLAELVAPDGLPPL
ncbi:MAG TPA: helix-turn-helix domain-containing protein [Mycobacteriales bacterium]|nr:helix-turn-helix domain-containing protein [Mycobacteriales bacterium]